MKIPSFIGGTDEQRSNNLSDNQLINLYPTTNNDGSIAAFYKVDGLKSEGTLSGVPTGAYKASNGRAFYTSGTVLYELTIVASVYTSTSRGTVTTATNYEFSDNGLEMIMVNGTDGWIFTFSDNALLKLTVLSDTFTVQAATAVDVDATLTQTAHGLIVGDRVILTTTGSLPDDLLPNVAYYVLADGFTVDSFKVGLIQAGATCTISNGVNCTVTSASHNYVSGSKVRFLTTGALPSPLAVGTTYYVISDGLELNSFRISANLGGVAITTTTAGSGVHSFNPVVTIIQTGMKTVAIKSKVTSVCTISVATPAIITKAAHGLIVNDRIQFTVSGGTLPTGISLATDYYVLYVGFTENSFEISLTPNGASINTTGAGSGIFSYTTFSDITVSFSESHNLDVGDPLYLATTGVLPNGLTALTKYYASSGGNGTGSLTLSTSVIPTVASVISVTYFGTESSDGSTSGTYIPLNTKIRLFSTDGTMFPGITSGDEFFVQQIVLFYTSGAWVRYSCLSYTELGQTQVHNDYPPGATSDFYNLNVDNYATEMYAVEDTKICLSTSMTSTYVPSTPLQVSSATTQSGTHSSYTSGSVAFGEHTYSTIGYGFPTGTKTVSYMNGRFIACDPNTQDFYVSEVLDGKTWNAINVQTVDSNPDYVTGQIVAHNELFVFCENSGETYYDSGTTPTPFVRNLTGIFEVGCKAPYTIKEIGGSIIFLGNTTSGNGIVYRMTGLTPVRISTYSIEYQIQQMSDISDARAFTYQKDGHHFYVLTFPTGNKTFVFDASTSLWHEREGLTIIRGSTTGDLTALTPSSIAASTTAYDTICSPDGLHVYTLNLNAYSISQYSRDQTTGALTSLTPSSITTTAQSYAFVMSADGLNIYVACSGSNLIRQYSRNATTGLLTELASVSAQQVIYIAISNDGLSVYGGSPNINYQTLRHFTRDTSTGLLTATSTVTYPENTTGLTVSVDGINVYAGHYSGLVRQYSRNTTTGVLSVMTPATVAAINTPLDIVISQDGKNVYTANGNGNTVSQFSRDEVTGQLTALSTPYISVADNPYSICITPNGLNVYTTSGSSGIVYKFSRNSHTGLLSAMTPASIAVASQSNGIGYSPDGDNLYLAGGNVTFQFLMDNTTANSYAEWPVNKYLYFNSEHLTTDDTTSLFSIDSSTYRNGTDPIRVVRSFRAPASDMKRVAHHTIQVDCEVGIGTGTEPVIALRWSDDAGNTWNTPIERGLGLVGDHSKSVIFRRLGSTKGIPRIYELSCDENVKITLLDCYLE